MQALAKNKKKSKPRLLGRDRICCRTKVQIQMAALYLPNALLRNRRRRQRPRWLSHRFPQVGDLQLAAILRTQFPTMTSHLWEISLGSRKFERGNRIDCPLELSKIRALSLGR